jgi:hypothetical protein
LATWQGFAPGSKWLQNGPVFPGFFCFLRVSASCCGNLLRCILRYFFDPLCNLCVGLCAVLALAAKRLAGAAVTSKTIDVKWILRDFISGLFMLTNERGNCFQQSGKFSAE